MLIQTNLEFEHPWFFLLFLFIPLFLYLKYRKIKKANSIVIPNLNAFCFKKNIKEHLFPLLYWIRLIIISLLILALCKPRISENSKILNTEKGIDIILAVDISLSMLAKDLEPDRLAALKQVATEFIKERSGDRIGVISYSGEAITLAPLTTDHDILIKKINNLSSQTLDGGTAIGVGLATAINHLKKTKTKNKVIILMTDGVNNDGFIDPSIAADIAAKENIKIYTIGIGTNGFALFPKSKDPYTGKIYFAKEIVEIDDALLKAIANKTKGKYFRATNKKSLENIYEQINKLEKTDINKIKYYTYTEKYDILLIYALILFLFEIGLRTSFFKNIN